MTTTTPRPQSAIDRVCAVLTTSERESFLREFCAMNPSWVGASVDDCLEHITDSDGLLMTIVAYRSEHTMYGPTSPPYVWPVVRAAVRVARVATPGDDARACFPMATDILARIFGGAS